MNAHQEEIYHHGIKGQKWGIRRFQNKSGGLTVAGKKRVQEAQKTQQEPKKKSVHEMSDDELRQAINRMKLEKEYRSLSSPANKTNISTGKKFVNDVLYKAANDVATEAAKNTIGSAVNKVTKTKLVNVKK